MCHDLLFQRGGHTIAGDEAEECAFVRGKPCTKVALDNPDHRWRYPHVTSEGSTCLGVSGGVGDGPPYVMEQGSCFYQVLIDKGVKILFCRFLYFTAMLTDCPAASCPDEQILPQITHNRGIS